jgi:hypothetical protein
MQKTRKSWLILACLLVLSACAPVVASPTATTIPTSIPETPTAMMPATQTEVEATAAVSTPVISLIHPPSPTPTLSPVGLAREHVIALSENIGSRVTGSTAESQAADYINAVLSSLAYQTEIETFYTKDESGKDVYSANITALKPGSSACQVIVGAHYDSVNQGSGADDNASGVAVMLTAAEQIQNVKTPCAVRFIAFGAEEIGLQGSQVYAQKMSAQEVSDTHLMVNLDSLLAGDNAYVYGDQGKGGVARDWLLERAKQQNLALTTQPGENPDYPAGTTGDWSDHAPFAKRGIPIVYFEATNWALGEKDGYTQTDLAIGEKGEIWHTSFDTLSYIDQTFPGRADQHLDLFTTLLIQLLSEYTPN